MRMLRSTRRRFALLCALAALACGFAHVQTARADDATGQSTSNSATSSATNSSSTSQTSSQTQIGGSAGGGQSQTSVQTASTGQNGGAIATATQTPTNIATGAGKADQKNTSSATSTAGNVNSTAQNSAQTQTASGGTSGAGGAGQAQSATQSAPTTQSAQSTATSTQQSPSNVNIVIRVGSPGNNGPVTQTNASQAGAAVGNTNQVSQTASQAQSGGGAQSGQAQQGTQSAPTTQVAGASASSTQVNPLNVNISVRVGSPGNNGPVTQTNSSQATAGATNANGVAQSLSQTQTAGGAGGGQSQVASQSAPTSQSATSNAASTQTAPSNGSISVTASSAPSPTGSGIAGTLIQIWIPNGVSTQGTNSSTASATSMNTNVVGQSAQQTQQAPSTPQVGGAGQWQVVTQSATTNQVANAAAASIQTTVTATSGAGVAQIASQTGDGVQVIEQVAGAEQAIDDAVRPRAGAAADDLGDAGCLLVPAQGRGLHASDAASSPTVRTTRPAGAPAKARRHAAPRLPQLPVPQQAPAALGAAPGSAGGGSVGVFAALLGSFLLVGLIGARRQVPSVVRRLVGVVTRLERPG